MIYFYCTSWQFFHIIVKWRISPTTEQIMFTFSILLFHFYSHIPCGMWLSYIWSIKITKIISTHTSRVGCDGCLALDATGNEISTHTSRVGCDFCGCIICWWRCISTHTSRVGCDYSCENIGMQAINFYSHIPCGMWRPYVLYCVVPRWISTHTSRVGCDHRQNYM